MNYEQIASELKRIRIGTRDISAAEELLRTLKRLAAAKQESTQLLRHANYAAGQFNSDIANSLLMIQRKENTEAAALEECIRILRRNIEGGW